VYCHKSSDWYDLWLNPLSLVPPAVNCWVDNVRLVYNPDSKNYSNNVGVTTRITDFGSTSGFVGGTGPTSSFHDLEKALEGAGLIHDSTIRGAPYDFRFAPDTTVNGYWPDMMVRLVEETYGYAGNKKVTIVSHSYGCPMTLYFLRTRTQAWKDRYIRQWLPTSGVFGGTGEGMMQLLSGYSAGTPAPATIVRVEQRSWESSMVLAPTPLAYGDRVLVTTPSRNYTANDYEALLRAAGMKYGWQRLRDAYRVVGNMEHPGIPVHSMYGVGVKTPTSYAYDVDSGFDKQPVITNGNGDGTVGIDSLQLAERRWSSNTSFAFTSRSFPGQSHSGILKDKDWINAVIELVRL